MIPPKKYVNLLRAQLNQPGHNPKMIKPWKSFPNMSGIKVCDVMATKQILVKEIGSQAQEKNAGSNAWTILNLT